MASCDRMIRTPLCFRNYDDKEWEVESMKRTIIIAALLRGASVIVLGQADDAKSDKDSKAK